MLVNNIQGVEMPENFSGSSTVWLDVFNRFNGLWSCFLDSGFRGFEILRIDRNWKLHAGKWAGRSLAENHQGMCQMVKSASNVVNGVASDQRSVFRNGWNVDHLINSISGFRIVLDSDSVFLAFLPGVSQLCEIEDVLVGPFQFG